MFRRLLLAYDAQIIRRPLAVKCATSSIIVACSDASSQTIGLARGRKQCDERTSVDFGRSLFIGFFYGGVTFAPILHYVTTTWMKVMPSKSPQALCFKMAVDMTTSFPLNLSIMIALQSFVRGTARDLDDVTNAVRANLWPCISRGWLFWPAVTVAMYAFVPVHYQVLFLNGGSFLWNTFFISAIE